MHATQPESFAAMLAADLHDPQLFAPEPPSDPAYEAHVAAELARLDAEGHTCHLDDPIGRAYYFVAPCAACRRAEREGR